MARRSRDPSRYSRFVRVVKFVLPLLAVAVLSTVFLVQREDPFDGRLVFSDTDRRSLDDGLTIQNPLITGTTAGGAGYRIAADTAVPDGPRPSEIRFTGLVAQTEQPSGRRLELVGDQGVARIDTSALTVMGHVLLTTSDGYRVQTPSAQADLAAGWIRTAEVVVDGPTGRIEAGSMRIEERPVAGGSDTKEVFFFDNGVRLVHQPVAGGAE